MFHEQIELPYENDFISTFESDEEEDDEEDCDATEAPKPLASHSQCLLSFQEIRNNLEYAGSDIKVFNALNLLEKEFLKLKINESSVQKKITDHFSQMPVMNDEDIMELCKSLEKSDLSESRINLHNQEICESCDENLVGTFKCHDCNDILCKKCYKAHSRLKVTKTHVVTPL